MSTLVQIGRHHFRFQCQPGCINCCTQPGDVYLTEDDAPRIAAYLELSLDEFKKRYCETVDGDLRLTTPPQKACHFLLQSGCSIHQVKPLQCRTFPFWPENVRNKRSWKAVGSFCPGIGVGPVLSRDEVSMEAQSCREGFPDF